MTGMMTQLCAACIFIFLRGAPIAAPQQSTQQNVATKSRYDVTYVDPFQLRDHIIDEGVDVEIRILEDGKLEITGDSEEAYRAFCVAKTWDIPMNSPNYHDQVVERVPLKHCAASELAQVLAASIDPDEVRIAVDERSNSLLFIGPSGRLRELQPIIEGLDTPKHSLRMEFYFIRGTIGGDQASPGLPPALQPVGEALVAAGFQSLELIAPIQILTEEGSSLSGEVFSQIASLDVPYTEGKSYRYSFEVSGAAPVATEGDTVKLQISAGAQGQEMTSEGHALPTTPLNYQIRTRITASLGQYIVLSAAPGTTPFGNALALVLKVERQSGLR